MQSPRLTLAARHEMTQSTDITSEAQVLFDVGQVDARKQIRLRT